MNVNKTKSRAGKMCARKSAWGRWNLCNFSSAISQDQIASMAKQQAKAAARKPTGETK